MKRVLISAIAALAITSAAQATLINETVAHDTHIVPRPDLVDANFGSSTRAIVGGTTTNNDFQVPLFRWTLSSVPAGEVAVTDGTITVQVRSTSFTNSDQFAVYKINSANAGWIQGDGGSGSPDADGEPTWNNLAHPSTPWTGGPGLGNNAGGAGYDPAFATIAYDGGTMGAGAFINITIPQAILNEWISNPAGNAGILMRQTTMDSVERLLQLYSLETDEGGTPASLSFETAVPEPSSLLALVAGGLLMGLRRRVA